MNKKPILHLYDSSIKAKLGFEEFLSIQENISKLSRRDLTVELEDEIHWFSYHIQDSDVTKHYGLVYADIIFNVEMAQEVKNLYICRIRWYKV